MSKDEPRVNEGSNDIELQSKELPVVLQKEINVYLHRSLPLCAILTDSRLSSWYYEHYIEIFSKTDDSGYITFEYLENEAPYNNVMRWICLGYELLNNVSSIVDFTKEKINQGYYMIIHLDEYYLPGKKAYHSQHFVHQHLVYGYDDCKKLIKVVCFDLQHSFNKITFDYQSFDESFENGKSFYKESAPWAEISAIELLKPRDFLSDYPFDIDRFYTKLRNYTFSKGDSSVVYNTRLDKELLNASQVKYGFQTYDDLLYGLSELLHGKVIIDYRAFHLLYEHKVALYKRLEYINATYYAGTDFCKLLEEYSSVVEQFNTIRFLILKLISIANEESAQKNIPGMVNKLIEAIESARSKEYSILESICSRKSFDL